MAQTEVHIPQTSPHQTSSKVREGIREIKEPANDATVA